MMQIGGWSNHIIGLIYADNIATVQPTSRRVGCQIWGVIPPVLSFKVKPFMASMSKVDFEHGPEPGKQNVL
jgi:hypothetical protein